MSLLPSLRIEFDKAMSLQQRSEAIEKVRSIKGVFSVSYDPKRALASVTYGGGLAVVNQVRAIDGLKVDSSHRL